MTYDNVDQIYADLAQHNSTFSKPPAPPVDPMANPIETQMAGMPTPEIDRQADEPSLVADLALAPVRGVLQAGESVADLLTLGNLPEGSINRLGHSKTAVGSLIENGTEFLVGFTPGFGWLSRASKLGKLAKLGKVGNIIAKSNVVKGAIAGAVADFSVFDEHQQRLSNLIESVPSLQNPVTDYLSAKDSDSIFEGRMKNAVEGLAVGGFIDGIIAGVKALRGAKIAVEAGDIAKANEILGTTGNTMSDEISKFSDTYEKQKFESFFYEEDLKASFNRPVWAVKLEDGTILADGQWKMHLDAIQGPYAVSKEDQAKIVDSGFIKDGEWTDKTFEGGKQGGTLTSFYKSKPKTHEEEVKTFLDSLKVTKNVFDILEKPDLTIDDIRASLMREGNRPIINMFKHKGVEDTHKSVVALAETLAEGFRQKNVVHKEEALANAISDLKSFPNGQAWLENLSAKVKDLPQLGNLVMGMKYAKDEVLNEWSSLVDDAFNAKKALDINVDDAVARQEYRKSFIKLNQFVPNIGKVLFGDKDLRENIARGLAMARWGDKDAKMLDQLSKMNDFWAKNTENMGQLETAYKEALGNGDAEAGKSLFDETIRRYKVMTNKYGIDGLNRVAPDNFWTKLHNEWWINFLLSGTRTFAVNAIGNALTTIWKPFESAVGAQLAFMRGGGDQFRTMRNSFLGQYGMMIDDAKDALVAANNAFKSGESSLVQNRTAVEEISPIITKENFEAKLKEMELNYPNASPMIKGIAKYLATENTTKFGNMLRLPTKALLWMDEFTKHLNFRSSAKSRAMAEAFDEASFKMRTGEIAPEDFDKYVASQVDSKINQLVMDGGGLYSMKSVRLRGAVEGHNLGLQGSALNDYISEYMAKNYDETKSNLAKYAYEWAQEVTFTKKGEPGTYQYTIEKAVRDHPSLRLVMPFVTTPTRIIKWFGQRAFGILGAVEGYAKNLNDVAPELSKVHLQITKELFSDDPFVRAQAEGKVAVGTALFASAIGLWANGSITGQGPKDEKQRILKQATGWQPYSIRFKLPNSDKYTYVSYQRFDPLATFLGVVADFGDKTRETQNPNKDWINFVGSAIGVALSKNITSKSYLTGIEQIMDAINQPDRKMENFISTRLGSLVVPSLVSQTIPMNDPLMREARTFLDIFEKRIPGLSQTLDPKRNILGEPVMRQEALGPDFASPLFVTNEKKDKVMDELANLKYSFSNPPVIESGGVDLSTYKNSKNQSAYDRYLELTSEVTINKKTLRESLKKLISDPKYQALTAEPEFGLESPRVAEIRKVISKYRATAKDKMIKEFPDLEQHRVLRDKIVMARKQGRTFEADQLLAKLRMDQ
ncbi:MAG: hypothetical protein EBU90_06820 [Proteobacteria bacterium]|nr:hypothetical protein [Pseudomonadota bacterium]NBP14040.1 hypothetical protein [bacterium]